MCWDWNKADTRVWAVPDRRKRERERNKRKQVHLPWSIMARLLFALGLSPALHSTYTSLLISQTPAVCQLILRFSKSITPLSKVWVPANLYCSTHIYTEKVNERVYARRSRLLSATDDGIQVSSDTLCLLLHVSPCPVWTCLVIIQG